MVLVARFRLQSLAQYQGQEATVAATVHELQPEFLKVVYIRDYNLGDYSMAVRACCRCMFVFKMIGSLGRTLAHGIWNLHEGSAMQGPQL